MTDRFVFHGICDKKINTNSLGPKTIEIVEGKGGWAKESRDRETPLQTKKKKGMREGKGSVLSMKKATRLASHFATMDFMIERAGNGVIPRELFDQTSHLIRGATCFRESS